MKLYAFQGLRYDRPAEEIDPLVAPPYDQIDARLRDQLHEKSPDQFAWLTRPVGGQSGDPYQESTRLHQRWLEDGTVTRDEEPSLYAYEIHLDGGGRRLGITGLAGVEDPASGVIRAHEATLAKPLADRVALLKANRVDLEPVFFLSEDGGALDALLEEDIAGGEAVSVHNDGAGNRHVLYRVSDPERIARYRDLLAPLSVAIADGHHRYKTACQFAAEEGAEEGTAEAAKLTVVTSIASPGLTIDPIHRALAELPDLSVAEPFIAERWVLESPTGTSLAQAVAETEQPALGVWAKGQAAEVWKLDASKAPADVPEGARNLTVALLHAMVMPPMGFEPESATDGTVIYRSDPERLAEELGSGELAVGLFLPPMDPEDFAAAIAHGDMLPPKSTRFLPKVFSGLVWADHDSELG